MVIDRLVPMRLHQEEASHEPSGEPSRRARAAARPLGVHPNRVARTDPAKTGVSRSRAKRSHIRGLVLLAAVGPVRALGVECSPVEIEVLSAYRAPEGFEFVSQEELRTRFPSAGSSLGIIEISLGWEVVVRARQWCKDSGCLECVERVEVEAGYGLGRQWLDAKLADAPCRTEVVLAHEAKHSRVFEESTRLGLKRLVDRLEGWSETQTATVVPRDDAGTVAESTHRDVMRIIEEAVDWIERRADEHNDRIDSPQSYEAEHRRMVSQCAGEGWDTDSGAGPRLPPDEPGGAGEAGRRPAVRRRSTAPSPPAS